MKRSLFLLPLALLLSGCTALTIPTQTQPVTVAPAVVCTGAQQNANPSMNYVVNFSDTESALTFALNSGDTIRLLVQSPTPKTVIRVGQIINGRGEADGPFTADTTFIAPKQDIYKFTIRANLMASQEPYSGNVVVNVTLKTK
jgi:hypothetical protein